VRPLGEKRCGLPTQRWRHFLQCLSWSTCLLLQGCVLAPLGHFSQSPRALKTGTLQATATGGALGQFAGSTQQESTIPTQWSARARLGITKQWELALGGYVVGPFQYRPPYWGAHFEGKYALLPPTMPLQSALFLGVGTGLYGTSWESLGGGPGVLLSYTFGPVEPYIGMRVMLSRLLGELGSPTPPEGVLALPGTGQSMTLPEESRWTLFFMPALGAQTRWRQWTFGVECALYIATLGGQADTRLAWAASLHVSYTFSLWGRQKKGR